MSGPSTPGASISTRQAAFIGVAAMVGAGIFSLLGAAGEVAGSAVWLSFLIAGAIAALQGYSFARLGARFPSAGGLLEYVNRGFGDGHISTVVAWLVYIANGIVTAMVALSFGSYASSAFAGDDPAAVKAFAVALLIVMTGLNIAGSSLVARVQSVVVFVVIGILAAFAVVTIANLEPGLIAPASYPPARDIVSSVALTFFAFLGFGVVTFTAKDLARPAQQLPNAMFIAIGLATLIYVAVSLGVFGTLTVDEVIAAGPTAIAVAAQPILGDIGFWLMTVTALFATAGATNAGLYPATGLSDHLASTGQFPTLMARRLGGRAPYGLIILTVAVIIVVVAFDLSAVASVGSAVALTIFGLVTVGHLRITDETGASRPVLLVALAAVAVTLATFVVTTLVKEPASIVTLGGILALSIVLDVAWSRRRGRTGPTADVVAGLDTDPQPTDQGDPA